MEGTGNPKILIVKLSAIGDVVHALPALNALRTRFPRAWITWLVEEAAAPLILGHPALDRVLISRRKQWLKGLKTPAWRENLTAMGNFVRRLRDTPYDMVIDLQASLKGAALILLARGRAKIGYGPGMTHQEESFRVLNRRLPMISMEVHALDRNLRLLEAIGVPCREIAYRLTDPLCDLTTQVSRAGLERSVRVGAVPGHRIRFFPNGVDAEDFRPDPEAERFVVEMACLLRAASGEVTVAHDRLEMGLFPRAFWLETLAAAGFEASVVPLEHSTAAGYEVFVGSRPGF